MGRTGSSEARGSGGSGVEETRGRLSPSCVVLMLSGKPRGSTAAQASGEESETPACASAPHGLEPAGSSAHPQRGKKSPLTTPRGHPLVCKVFIAVFGRDSCVCVLRKRKKNNPVHLGTQQAVSTHDISFSLCLAPCHHPHGDPVPGQLRGQWVLLPHVVPGAQDLLRSVCVFVG